MMTVGIVNDSRMASEVLRRVLATCDGFRLAWSAASGEEAVERCASDLPDILLMDLVMPGMDGAEATRLIMRSTPCIILVVTATTVGNRDKVFEAMGNGALDAVNTPTLGAGEEIHGSTELVRKLQTVSRFVAGNRAPHTPARLAVSSPSTSDNSKLPVIAIGSSTGGPQALATILSHLPQHFPAAILIAQHVDEQFAPGLAAWLQHHTPLPVRIAQHGEQLSEGGVWIAGTNDHMIYQRGGTVDYTPNPRESAYRPSVDVLFESLTLRHRALRLGVLLTGMGRDGGAGLLALRNSGAHTIAQDAATSIVYGMPKAGAEMGGAEQVLPIEAIGPRIRQLVETEALAPTHSSGGHHKHG
jgi:two-component system response regulator WspF